MSSSLAGMPRSEAPKALAAALEVLAELGFETQVYDGEQMGMEPGIVFYVPGIKYVPGQALALIEPQAAGEAVTNG